MIESTSDILIDLLFFMLALAVIGEPLRVLFSRFSRLFRNLDILQVLVLNVYLGGLILYVIAIAPFGLFGSVMAWVVFFFSLSFVVAELLIRRPRLPRKFDALRCTVVLTIFLIALGIRLNAVSGLIFGSIHDTSVHSLFVQLILENRQVPALLLPYASEGIIYPQGFHPIVAFVACISDYLVPSAVLYITTLLGAMSVLGAYFIGKALSSKWYFGVSLALVSAFISAYPKTITWGSNAFVASIPLYFVCLSFVPSILKEEREFSVPEIVVIGVLFGYLAVMHLQPFETLIATIGLWWLIKTAVSKHRTFLRIRYILVVLFISLIIISPFFYRWLIWHPYPYHNIGLPEDVEYPKYRDEPYSLSNFPDISSAILSSLYFMWDHLSPYFVLRGIYLMIVFLSIVNVIVKSRKDTLDNAIVHASLSAIGGQMLVMLLAIIFPSSFFSPQPLLFYLSLDMLIGVFAVWLSRDILLQLSKKKDKVNLRHSRFGFARNPKVLKVGFLVGILMYTPFVYYTVFHDPQEIRGSYRVWSITTQDDLKLMLWMKDNLQRNSVILVNQYESGLFIPSLSYHKIIFPHTASSFSRSYMTLSTMLEDGNLNATTYDLMNQFNATYVFIGRYTSAFEMYKHKWNPQPFLQNPNFDLVAKVGNAYLFAISCKYPEIAFQDDFEYESPDETGWKFYVAEECEGTGSGEAAITSNHTYHGNKSLVITAKRDTEWYYSCWVHKNVHVWEGSNVTLSFYLNATSGFTNDLDHSKVIIADTSGQHTITLSTPYAYINPEYIELPDSQGYFQFNLSEIWRQKHNFTLPTNFSIRLKNFDADGTKNIVFFDYIKLICS